MAETIDVEPGGDVVLVCGAGEGSDLQKRLRVSSTLLCRASSVFKAMLSPRFQEGTALRDQGALELALSEDDAQALETVCAIIHARPELLPATLLPQQLLTFALVCDKYDFVEYVKHSAHYLVSAMLNQAGRDVLALWVPLPAAWYLRLEDLFERASREMVLGNP